MSASGVKRPREREQADRRQEHRVEEVLAHTAHIVDAIANINTSYVRTLNDEREGLTRRVTELQTLHTSDQLRQSEAAMELVHHRLQSLRGVVSGTVKERLLCSLRAQVDRGNSEVLEGLTAHVDEALQGALTVADTQLTAERQLSSSLVEQLRSYAQTLLATAKAADQRAFQAEVESMQKDIALAKLRAAHLFEQNRLLRHEQEVEALMRVVTQLAEKSRFVESARTELQRAKRHVRWLEQYLELNHIIAAALPESEATTAATAALSSSTSAPPPNPALRQSAPHYFALKMLEHKDVTLTELVDAWQAQEGRIAAAERRYAQLEEVVSQVQHDALVVHQRYLEEKQRREIADRRITDMVRERLHPQQDGSVVNEVQRLRWAYTEVVDDAAQLAVSLKVCRDELQMAQTETEQLKAQVAQLKRDAETDQVALTIEELRREYAERVRGLEEVSVRTQLQLTLAQQVSRQYGSVAEEATTTLREVSATNAELSAVPPRVAQTNTAAPSRGDWRRDVERVEAQAERLTKLAAEVKNHGLVHGELYEAQVTALMEQWSRVRSEAAARAERVGASTTTDFASTAAASPFSPSASLSESHTLVPSSLSEETVTRLSSVSNSSKMALREALTVLVVSLQSIDVERSNLLEASLSDAQYVTELASRIGAVTRERDRLRAQLKVCRDLLDKNHVTVVERALMHDVPAEDSLNVAEATERITVLRDELSAARQVCDRALGEVRQVTAEREAAEARLTELRRSHEVLQGHAARLTERLLASQARETSLMEEAVSLQGQMVHLVQSSAQTTQRVASTESEETAVEATTTTAATTTPSGLSALFASLSDTLQRLEGEVQALHTARADTTSTPSAADDTASTAAGQQRGDSSGNDAELVHSLSRSGMMNVVSALKDTLHTAGLLRASLRSAAGAQAAALCATAESAATSGGLPSALPAPPLETQRRALEYRAAQQEARLAQYAAEHQQMGERLQRAEQAATEREAANQRLLAISKSVLEKQSLLKTENEQLRTQVQALLTQAAASAAAAAAAAAVIIPEAPVAASEQPPPSGEDDTAVVAAEAVSAPTAAETPAETVTAPEHAEVVAEEELSNTLPDEETAAGASPAAEEDADTTPPMEVNEARSTAVADEGERGTVVSGGDDGGAAAEEGAPGVVENEEETAQPPTAS